MTGIRTASLLTVVAGLCFVAGRGGVYPSEVLASLAPDGVVMRRLQIVMGRPAPVQPEALDEEPVPATVPAVFDEQPAVVDDPEPQPVPAPAPTPALAQGAQIVPAGEALEQAPIDEFRGTFAALERANLRKGPERDGRRMAVIREGEELAVTGRTLDGEWYRVRRGDEDAYVASDLVRPVRIDTPLGELDFDALDRSLDELDELLRGARFDQVVAAAQRLRVRLWTARRFVSVKDPAVRIESAAGVALIALGRTTDAEECFGRALEAEPELELDATRFSPKVLRTFQQVRSAASPS
jgi:hypothetical protein